MKILIADDESIIRMGLKSMLQDMGHFVVSATNGREAIQMARKQRPDLAILDINMPYTDGIRAAKDIIRLKPIPVIMLTAFSTEDVIEKATDLPIQGYLVKPIQQGALQAAIRVAEKRFDETIAMRRESEKLAIAIETRKIVDRAKGKLMQEKGLNEEAAYRLLQLRARESRKSLKDIASAVLAG